MSDYDSRTMRGPEVDVDAAVRRGQRRFKMRLAMMWVTVLAVTAVLVGAAVVARAYVHSLTIPWRVSPVLPASASLRLLVATAGALLLLVLAVPVIGGERARRQLRWARQYVRVEAHTSVGHVTVDQAPQSAPTVSVRFIPHYDAGTVTVKEVAG